MKRTWPPIQWAKRAWPRVNLPDYPRDRRTVCYHEAAHAVLGTLFNYPIGSAHVFEDAGKVHGKVEMTPRQPRDTSTPIPPDVMEVAAVRLAAMYLSGIVAELLLHGIEVRGWLNLNSPDWRNARAALFEAFGHDWAMFYCQNLAAAILAANWVWVQAVADALEDAGTLSPEAVRQLCPDVSPDC